MISKEKKYFNRLLLSFSSVSRGIFTSVFGLIVNYLLLHYKSHTVLDAYVYCISMVNLVLVFANWGGKDYNIKTLTAHAGNIAGTLQAILSSRILLFFIPLAVILLIPADITFRLFMAAYLVLRVIGSTFESLISVRKKFHAFLLVDLFLNTAFVLVILLDHDTVSPGIFLAELLIVEFLKVITCLLFFRSFITFSINLEEGYRLIVASQYFFYISLAGFVCSKADLYVVGLFLKGVYMSRYFIILNLVGLSQVCYAAFIGTFSSNIFRYSQGSFKKFAAYSARLGLVCSAAAAGVIYFICNAYYRIELDAVFTAFVFLNVLFFTFVLTQMYHYTRGNRQKRVILVLVISALANVVASLSLTGTFGMKGAFASNTFCLLCTLVLLNYFSKHERD